MNQRLLLPVLAVIVLIFAWMALFGGLFTPDNHEVSVAIAGDVMMANNIPTVLNGSTSAFAGISNVTSAADLLLFNFDNAVTYSDNAVKKNTSLRCEPRFVDLIRANDNTVVALANGHVCDFGVIGIRDTISELDEKKIAHLGVGEDENQSRQNVTQEINGRKITIFNYMDSNMFKGFSYDELPYANGLAPGYAAYDSKVAQKQISQAKEEGNNVIVYMHFGKEFSKEPNDDQKRIAHELVDYGADIVVGSHPHVAQGIEMYNGRPIFYSLGDCISDLGLESTQDSYIVQADFIGDSVECSIYPIHLNNCIPYFSDPSDGSSLLTSLSPQCGQMQINNGVGKLQFNITNGDEH